MIVVEVSQPSTSASVPVSVSVSVSASYAAGDQPRSELFPLEAETDFNSIKVTPESISRIPEVRRDTDADADADTDADALDELPIAS